MKLHIYTTNHQFLEEPIRVGFCGKIEAVPSNDCKCDMGIFKRISTPIAEIDFGKRFFDCNTGRCNHLSHCTLKATPAVRPKIEDKVGCNHCDCHGPY